MKHLALKYNPHVSLDFEFYIYWCHLLQIKKKSANIWQHEVGNNANIANFVWLWKTRIDSYTVPFGGYYEFGAAVRVKGDYAAFIFWVDGQSERYCWTSGSTFYTGVQVTCTIITSLKAGQNVQIKTNFAGELWEVDSSGICSWFSSYLCFLCKSLQKIKICTWRKLTNYVFWKLTH